MSDLQNRLTGIMDRMKALGQTDKGPVALASDQVIRQIAADVAYVANVLRLHLETDEK